MPTIRTLESIEFHQDGERNEYGLLDKLFRFHYADGTEEVKSIANKDWQYIEQLGQKCPVEILWTYQLGV